MKTILFIWKGTIEPNRAGIPRVTSLLMKGLANLGYDCLNIVINDDYSKLYINNTISDATALTWINLKNYLIDNHIDIIINQDAYSAYFSKWWKYNKIKNVKYIIVFHSTPKLYHYQYSAKRLFRDLIYGNKSLKRWCLPRLLLHPLWYKRAINKVMNINRINYFICDKFVLLSERFIPIFTKISKISDNKKCVSINNPLSFETICDVSILRQKKHTILIVSRLSELEKRLSLSLHIWSYLWKKYPNWQLRIVGHGPDEEYYKKLVTDLKISNIKFTGRKESYDEYLDASIFLMTSAYEGWGLTLTESLQTGVVPVVMDSYESLHDIIKDGYNGIIIKNNDIYAFTEAVEALINNKEKREQIANNCLESSKQFTLNKTIEKWIHLIENL